MGRVIVLLSIAIVVGIATAIFPLAILSAPVLVGARHVINPRRVPVLAARLARKEAAATAAA